ncbi:MAG: helix-turn-helix domain-containing protein [Chitinophagaceae bacterium]|nr:helix-turn-helix domain-containing protein [Chitinophagaceae bacterium]
MEYKMVFQVHIPAFPLNQFIESLDAELVLTNDILDMREMILASSLLAQKFYVAENYLLKKFRDKLIVNPFIEFAVNSIISSPNQMSIEEIAGKVGYSQKHLIKLFKDNVGLTPKGFLKVIRFQKAIEEIAAAKQINWTGIAYECGYYDQAHFINDFKTFSGFTPEEYLQKQYEHLNYIVVG